MDLLWNFLSFNDLTIDISGISSFLKCDLCSSIMKYPIVTTCGCTFCNDCIKNYLGEDIKPCPSCVKDNIINELSYNRDVTECKNANKEISRSTINCPQEGCIVKCELRSLLNHLQTCQMKHEACILKNIGCTSMNMNGTAMETHLNEDMRLHFHLIAENLCILKNDVESIQADCIAVNEFESNVNVLKKETAEMLLLSDRPSAPMQKVSWEIELLGDSSSHSSEKLQESLSEIGALRDEVDQTTAKIGSFATEMQTFVMETSETVDNFKRDTVKFAAQKIQDQDSQTAMLISNINFRNEEIRILKLKISQEIGKLKKDVPSLKSEFSNIRDEIEKEKLGRLSYKTRLAQIEDDILNIKAEAETKFSLEPGPSLAPVLEPVVSCRGLGSTEQHFWTPENLSQYYGQNRWSDSFNVKGYCMSLWMVWTKPRHLGTWLCLLRSPNDANLMWPMQLRLCLMISHTGKKIKSILINCTCGRPETTKVFIERSRIDIGLDDFDKVKNSDSVSISVDVL